VKGFTLKRISFGAVNRMCNREVLLMALAFAVSLGGTHALAQATGYDGRWIADVPRQGSCPASHMTLFVHDGGRIDGSVFNPSGTFPFTGQIDQSGEGTFRIVAFAGHIRFAGNQFAAAYANACGERRAVGVRLTTGQPS
jgi:hypothetical protein